jgi:hypothetical protein
LLGEGVGVVRGEQFSEDEACLLVLVVVLEVVLQGFDEVDLVAEEVGERAGSAVDALFEQAGRNQEGVFQVASFRAIALPSLRYLLAEGLVGSSFVVLPGRGSTMGDRSFEKALIFHGPD